MCYKSKLPKVPVFTAGASHHSILVSKAKGFPTGWCHNELKAVSFIVLQQTYYH